MTDDQKAEIISKKYEDWWATEAPDVEKAAYDSAMEMAEWKDEQYNEEKRELLGLVEMLRIDSSNQTIIEDLKALLM